LGFASCFVLPVSCFRSAAAEPPPNVLFVFTDDQRHDAMGCAGGTLPAITPSMDRLAARGVRFRNAFAVLAICSPSRAAVLTGLYGSVNGVTAVGADRLRPGAPTFAQHLRAAGWRTGMSGKWHIGTPPAEAGFDSAAWFPSNGPYYNRKVTVDGVSGVAEEMIDEWVATQAIRFLAAATNDARPFVFWMCTQLPHMNDRHDWDVTPESLAKFPADRMPLPATWNDDLTSRPAYLKTARNRMQALEYGYDSPDAIRRHIARYLAAVHETDAAIGRVLDALDRLGLAERTVVILMGDNGWFLGEHGFTSKVLPYEESMRVPLIVAGPGVRRGAVEHRLVLNLDVGATIPDLAGLPTDATQHGRSLSPLLRDGPPPADWRTDFLYEAPTPQLGSRPLWAVRTERWKYVRTEDPREPSRIMSEELYDLAADAFETNNLSPDRRRQDQIGEFAGALRKFQVDLERDRERRQGTGSR
jgi:arylsulfatase A-like enzyme